MRIVLNLKGVRYRRVAVDLRAGAQGSEAYRAINPQGLVPTLEIDGHVLTQSLAIIDYLDATHPDPPLVPLDPAARSRTLARALAIAADIHPIQNLRVMNRLRSAFAADDDAVFAWNRHWIELGFAALEADAPEHGTFGGGAPDLADVCLVPQMANARRFGVAMSAYPRLAAIDERLRARDAFARAAPEAVGPG